MELPCGSGDDFRDSTETPAFGLLWTVLRPPDSPKTAQESPRELETAPREPGEVAEEAQERPSGSSRRLLNEA